MIKRSLLTIFVIGLTVFSGLAYPVVHNDPNNIVLNTWTRQVDAAKLKARVLNRPIMLVFVDTVTCSKCKFWDANTLSQAAWPAFYRDNPMILIWLDRNYSQSQWDKYKVPYVPFGFPLIIIISPTGTQLDRFEATGTLGSVGPFVNRVNNSVKAYPYSAGPGTIGLNSTAQSVAEDGGAMTVTVTRTEGTKGAQQFSYTTADGTAHAGTDYTAAAGTLAWADGDGANKSFSVPLLDNGRWTAPSQRVFTVTIAKTAGDATVGTTVQTVTIHEAEPYAPGTLGFNNAAGQVVEGTVYTGTVSRSGGAVGAAGATLTVPAGYTVAPATLAWADGNSDQKLYTVSGITATEQYDPRTFDVTLALNGGSAALGLATHTVTVLDQAVSETFDEYIADRPVYEHLVQEDELWFYNEPMDALRTEPLNGGAQAVLAWTAPEAGRLSFTWGQNGISVPVGAVGPLGVAAEGVLWLEVDGESIPLMSLETNNTVGLRSGEVVRWVATGVGGDYVAYLTDMDWEALSPVAAAALSPTEGSKLQIDDVRDDNNLVDLVWQAGAGNPAGTVQRLLAGASVGGLADVPVVGGAESGLNAVDLGIVTLDEAQGWVYWRVDTVLAADFGDVVCEGPVWRFAVVDLPVFTKDSPDAGTVMNAFLRSGAMIATSADSATPVRYSAVGLPSGLTIDPNTGVISGTARSAGAFSVTVTATNSEGSASLTFTIQTQVLPAYASNVTLSGAVFDAGLDTPPVAGTLSFKVSRSGRITAKVEVGNKSHSLRGEWGTGEPDGTFRATLPSRSGEVLEAVLTADGVLRGTFNGLPVLAKSLTAVEVFPFVGYYTAGLPAAVLEVGSPAINNNPQGYGYLTLTVSRSGRVSYGGLLADNERLSGSGTLMVFTSAEMQAMGYEVADGSVYAAFPLYKSLYSRRGSVSALVWFEANNINDVRDNAVWIDNSRWHYPGKRASLNGDAFLAEFGPRKKGRSSFSEGAVHVGAFFVKGQDLTLKFNGPRLYVETESVPVTAERSSLSLERGNEIDGRLKASASTGLFAGSFRWVDPGSGRKSTQRFKGVLLSFEAHMFGAGAYQRLDSTTGSYRLNRSWPVAIESTDR